MNTYAKIYIDAELHKRLKLAALKADKTLTQFVKELILKRLDSTGPIPKVVAPTATPLDANSLWPNKVQSAKAAEELIMAKAYPPDPKMIYRFKERIFPPDLDLDPDGATHRCEAVACKSVNTTLITGEGYDTEGFLKKYSKWLCVKHRGIGV